MTNHDLGRSSCPCGSKKMYAECCQVLHMKKAIAKTPEQLMRSRYSAYALGGLGNYLAATWHPDNLGVLSNDELNDRTSNWVGLNIIQSSVSKNGIQGQVEFIAAFEDLHHQGKRQFLHEYSNFEKVNGAWVYTEGDIRTIKFPKRNESCLCGSDLKFKKCCAAFV